MCVFCSHSFRGRHGRDARWHRPHPWRPGRLVRPQGQSICQRDDETVCIDKATLGGFGSAITFTGFNKVFLAVPDRGPFDGRTDTPYWDRFHFLHLALDTRKPFPNIRTTLLDTRFLRNEWSRHFVGNAYAFDTEHPSATRRFDPEGVALSDDGTFFVSDEYGPYIFEFDRYRRLVRRVRVPKKFRLAPPPLGNPTGDVDSAGNSWELYPQYNVTGRQANRGMERLAITPTERCSSASCRTPSSRTMASTRRRLPGAAG